MPDITWQARDYLGRLVEVTGETEEGSTALRVSPQELEAGGGLPGQWTETPAGQVQATADDPDEAVLTVKAAAGSEGTGDLVFEVQGETGATLLSVDPYGFLVLHGAAVDPSNGGSGLAMRNASAQTIFSFTADNGAGGSTVYLGAATTELGFFGVTPVTQQSAIADATDAPSTMARLNDLLAALRALGLIDT